MEQLITTYGYLAILIGTFFEGETILIMGGFLAHRGYLHLPWVIMVAFFGSLAGDQLFYYVGRWKGADVLAKRQSWQRKVDRLHGLLRDHRLPVIVGFRFLYGLRMAAPFLIGTSGVSPGQFLVLNGIGAAIWSIIVGFLGYSVGLTIELFLTEAKHYEMLILGAIAVIGSVVWFVHFLYERTQR
jgi:membrane protein DedA with SNARE-associated domain